MPKTELGYHCSHEQLPPSALLRHARSAAEAGFVHAMCSDHFHPWSERQGHSGYAWSWLGAALQATPLSWGTVCAPGQRYHPAIIAQAAATLTEMNPGRFWFAVGSGEALNEAITGERWPSKAHRHARLESSVAIMRTLWRGEAAFALNPVAVSHAHLYTRPAVAPPLFGAALTPDTARWLAPWVDGLITVAGPRDSMRAIIEAFREAGGAEKPVFLQVALAFAPTDAEARFAAFDQWRHAALPTTLLADLRTPAEFDTHSEEVTVDAVLERVRASADVERHLAWIEEDAELGYDRIYLHNVARDHMEIFIDACAERLLPAFAGA